MKRGLHLLVILCCVTSSFLLSSCSGYNARMRKHLCERNNYEVYHGVICDIYYYDEENNKESIFVSEDFPERDMVFEIAFDDYDAVKAFLGGNPNSNMGLSDFKFQFRITRENNQVLMKNGFYDTISRNTSIDITASSYIYMDSDSFFIAGISYNETEYLSFETGFSNIESYVNQHKSLL